MCMYIHSQHFEFIPCNYYHLTLQLIQVLTKECEECRQQLVAQEKLLTPNALSSLVPKTLDVDLVTQLHDELS